MPMTDRQDVSLIKDDTLAHRRRCRCDAKRGESFGGDDRASLVACRFCNLCTFFGRQMNHLRDVLARDVGSRPCNLEATDRDVRRFQRANGVDCAYALRVTMFPDYWSVDGVICYLQAILISSTRSFSNLNSPLAYAPVPAST